MFGCLPRVQARGVAFWGEERAEGLRCIAATFLSTADRVLCAISVAGPTTRIKDERFRSEIPELVTKATERHREQRHLRVMFHPGYRHLGLIRPPVDNVPPRCTKNRRPHSDDL